MKKQIQKGFTLIELMIVIAIIGILASIALPAYQDYIARTQATEAFKVTSGLQTDIGVYLADQNDWPNAAEVNETTGRIGKLAAELDGKYFDPGEVKVEAGTGVISVKFSAGANADHGMKLTPGKTATGQVTGWTCAGDTALSQAGEELSSKRLPSSCQ